MLLLTLFSAAMGDAGVTNMNGEYIYWKTPGAPKDISFPTNLIFTATLRISVMSIIAMVVMVINESCLSCHESCHVMS